MRKSGQSFRIFHLFIGLLLVATGMILLGNSPTWGIGVGMLLAGLLVPAIPMIGDWYAAKRDQNN